MTQVQAASLDDLIGFTQFTVIGVYPGTQMRFADRIRAASPQAAESFVQMEYGRRATGEELWVCRVFDCDPPLVDASYAAYADYNLMGEPGDRRFGAGPARQPDDPFNEADAPVFDGETLVPLLVVGVWPQTRERFARRSRAVSGQQAEDFMLAEARQQEAVFWPCAVVGKNWPVAVDRYAMWVDPELQERAQF